MSVVDRFKDKIDYVSFLTVDVDSIDEIMEKAS